MGWGNISGGLETLIKAKCSGGVYPRQINTWDNPRFPFPVVAVPRIS